MKTRQLLLLSVSLLALVGCSSGKDKKQTDTQAQAASTQMESKGYAHAHMKSATKKNLKGTVQIWQVGNGYKVVAEVSGLKPNSAHGFHIHEFGKCDAPDYKSAGGHFNPGGHDHGAPTAKAKHIGDLGNLVADSKGVAKTEITIEGDYAQDMPKTIGKALIIHAKADDFKTQPTGNSGDRIACGLLMKGAM